MKKPISVYLHVPFCLHRCNYCAFYSTTQCEDIDEYVKALCREIEASSLDQYEIQTIYFGGGTPSLLKEKVPLIISVIERKSVISKNAEITLEANPKTINMELLTMWKEAGINRLSVGLQDGHDDVLKKLGRIHTVQEGREAIKMARKAGFDNISGDLILATPGQDVRKAMESVDFLESLELEHVSAYLLGIEPGTPFDDESIKKELPDEDVTADIYLAVSEKLKKDGYHQYEVSNYAKIGKESKHNMAYWKLTDYMGFGPAAHSLLDKVRYYHEENLKKYISAKNPWEQRKIEGSGNTAEEILMLSLRLDEGFDLATAKNLGMNEHLLISIAQPLIEKKLAIIRKNHLSLTTKGFLISNAIISTLMMAIEEEEDG